MNGLRKWEVGWMDGREGRGMERGGKGGRGGKMWEDRNQNFCKSNHHHFRF